MSRMLNLQKCMQTDKKKNCKKDKYFNFILLKWNFWSCEVNKKDFTTLILLQKSRYAEEEMPPPPSPPLFRETVLGHDGISRQGSLERSGRRKSSIDREQIIRDVHKVVSLAYQWIQAPKFIRSSKKIKHQTTKFINLNLFREIVAFTEESFNFGISEHDWVE